MTTVSVVCVACLALLGLPQLGRSDSDSDGYQFKARMRRVGTRQLELYKSAHTEEVLAAHKAVDEGALPETHWTPMQQTMKRLRKTVGTKLSVNDQVVSNLEDQVESLSRHAIEAEEHLRMAVRIAESAKWRSSELRKKANEADKLMQEAVGEKIDDKAYRYEAEAARLETELTAVVLELEAKNKTVEEANSDEARHRLMSNVARKWGSDTDTWEAQAAAQGITKDYVDVVLNMHRAGQFSPEALKADIQRSREARFAVMELEAQLKEAQDKVAVSGERAAGMKKLRLVAMAKHAAAQDAESEAATAKETVQKLAKEEATTMVLLGEATEKFKLTKMKYGVLEPAI